MLNRMMIQMILKMIRRRFKPKTLSNKSAKREAELNLMFLKLATSKLRQMLRLSLQRRLQFQATTHQMMIPHLKMTRKRSNPLLKLLQLKPHQQRKLLRILTQMIQTLMMNQRRRLQFKREKHQPKKLLNLNQATMMTAMIAMMFKF